MVTCEKHGWDMRSKGATQVKSGRAHAHLKVVDEAALRARPLGANSTHVLRVVAAADIAHSKLVLAHGEETRVIDGVQLLGKRRVQVVLIHHPMPDVTRAPGRLVRKDCHQLVCGRFRTCPFWAVDPRAQSGFASLSNIPLQHPDEHSRHTHCTLSLLTYTGTTAISLPETSPPSLENSA